jgi:hypothetical protein
MRWLLPLVLVSDPKNVAEMRATRAKNGMDEKVCWK